MTRGHWVRDLINTIEEYRLEDRFPQEVGAVVFLAREGRLSDHQARAWLMMKQPWLSQLDRQPNLLARPPDAEELGHYDIELGELAENPGVRVGVRIIDRARHGIISGLTGSGKSTLLARLIKGVAELNQSGQANIVLIVLDPKGDYVEAADWLGRDRCAHYSVHDNFKVSLHAPGDLVPPVVWCNEVAQILGANCGLVMGTDTIAAMIRFSLAALNPSPVKPLLWPSIPWLNAVSQQAPRAFSSKDEYSRSVRQVLRSLTESSAGIFDTLRGFDLWEHVIKPRRSAVIDLTTLDPRLSSIAVELIASGLLLPRIYNRETYEGTDVLLIVDEADPLCSARAGSAYRAGYSCLGRLLKQGRQFGISAFLGVSFLGQTSLFIRNNVSYHFTFAQPDAESVYEAARTLMIPRGGEGLLATLQVGQCVYREALGPCSTAALVQADFVPASRRLRPEHFDHHPYVPGKRLADLPRVQQALQELIHQHKATTLRQAASKPVRLSEKTLDLLSSACLHPESPVAAHWRQIGTPSLAVQKKARQQLADRELAVFEEVRIGRRNVLLIEPTDAGYNRLNRKPRNPAGRGGIAHRRYCRWVMMYLERQGLRPQIEAVVPGTSHPADVAYCVDGRWHVYEIVSTCDDNLIQHAEACLLQSSSVETLTIVAAQKSILALIERKFRAEGALAPVLRKVRWQPLEPILEALF